MSDNPKYSGVGPHGTMPSLSSGKSREEIMAEFKARMKAPHDPIRYLLGDNPDPKEAARIRRRLAKDAEYNRRRDEAAGIKPEPQYPRDYPWVRG